MKGGIRIDDDFITNFHKKCTDRDSLFKEPIDYSLYSLIYFLSNPNTVIVPFGSSTLYGSNYKATFNPHPNFPASPYTSTEKETFGAPVNTILVKTVLAHTLTSFGDIHYQYEELKDGTTTKRKQRIMELNDFEKEVALQQYVFWNSSKWGNPITPGIVASGSIQNPSDVVTSKNILSKLKTLDTIKEKLRSLRSYVEEDYGYHQQYNDMVMRGNHYAPIFKREYRQYGFMLNKPLMPSLLDGNIRVGFVAMEFLEDYNILENIFDDIIKNPTKTMNQEVFGCVCYNFKRLCLLGVAHNDFHTANVVYSYKEGNDDYNGVKTKVRIIDFGRSSISQVFLHNRSRLIVEPFLNLLRYYLKPEVVPNKPQENLLFGYLQKDIVNNLDRFIEGIQQSHIDTLTADISDGLFYIADREIEDKTFKTIYPRNYYYTNGDDVDGFLNIQGKSTESKIPYRSLTKILKNEGLNNVIQIDIASEFINRGITEKEFALALYGSEANVEGFKRSISLMLERSLVKGSHDEYVATMEAYSATPVLCYGVESSAPSDRILGHSEPILSTDMDIVEDTPLSISDSF